MRKDGWIDASKKRPKEVGLCLLIVEKDCEEEDEEGPIIFNGDGYYLIYCNKWEVNGIVLDDSTRVLYWQPWPRWPKELRGK